MRLQIHGGHSPASEDSLAPFVDCHARIRHFTALATKLGALEEATPGERAEAAAGLHRYFTVAYPLHAGDEDLLLVPALAHVGDAGIAEVLGALEPQHRALDALLAELVPLWAELARAPERWAAHRGLLEKASARLAEQMAVHISLEEEKVFPAARQLDAEVLAGLRRAVAARREVGR